MKQGDEDAIDIFVRGYYPDILNYCSHHCKDREWAEDLTQETFVRFFQHLDTYRHLGKAKNYLYTIAANLCRDHYKKAAEIPMDQLPEPEVNQSQEVQNKLFVEWALGRLPTELREVVILYYFHDMKLKDIAGILQIGLPLVKYRIKRAKAQLEELFREEESV
ncbi:RNA polymerase sigma factor [Anaerovorax odorimutans]|uniref:RNA polymerase sigma factor n=2 Tax=Anaerovorax odorimutans TaxID=109327 RepID=A0ABT1RMK9_9FIRM|nr:RNA polymerase sigma factor [Anaerovorax odorimutans]MCQ4636407.1 RNA polymerase sigma factor [Anaerovorax odorimutans]